MTNFKKQHWLLFKLDRSDYNRADAKIEKILLEVYNKGKKDGRKETVISLITTLKSRLKLL